MASKYLSSGTATWTNSTRTISAATMTPVFEQADEDEQRQLTFRIGADIFFGRIATFVSTTSVTMLAVGTLPSGDGTIDDIILFDLAEAHTFQDYLDEVASKIKDDAGKLTTTSGGDVDKILADAVRTYSHHRGFFVKKSVTGDGTQQYALPATFGSLWVHGYSFVKSIEFPDGSTPPTMLEMERDWILYDDGTAQDGTNIKLRFLNETPGTSDTFIAELLTEMDLPRTGQQNFPDTDDNFTNITTLSAAVACRRLAAAYAQSSDTTIAADSVDYHDKSRKYTDLAKEYMKAYNLAVFGAEEPAVTEEAAFSDKDMDLATTANVPFLFHGGRNR